MTESRNKRLRNRHLLSWNSKYPVQQGYRTQDPEARAGLIRSKLASDAARSPMTLMTRRVHLVAFAVLIPLGGGPVSGADPGSVSGLVSDSSGVPQIGAQ